MRNLSKELDGYTIGEAIGRGARSVIHEVKRETDGKVFAAKCVHVRNEDDRRVFRHLKNENHILEEIHGTDEVPPQIVRRVDFVQVRKFFRLKGACLILERVPGPDLQRYSDYSLDVKIDFMAQICKGLMFIHEQGYIHGDLKPDNMLLDDSGEARLIDFGFAAPIGSDVEGVKGTWGYLAPEQTGGVLDPKTDVYNLGATMYWLFTGENLPYVVPNGDKSAGFIGAESLKPTPPHQLNPDLPRELSELLLRCCNSDGGYRPPLQRVYNMLHDLALRRSMSV